MMTGIIFILGIIIFIKIPNVKVAIPDYFFNWQMALIIIGIIMLKPILIYFSDTAMKPNKFNKKQIISNKI